MENKNSNIITISLKDMNRFIFKEKRKFMIILMLIFAILFGFIRSVTTFKRVGKISATKEEIASEKAYQKTKQNYMDEIDRITEKIDKENEYQKDSILYNIDSSNVYRGNLIYSIVPAEGTSVDNVLALSDSSSISTSSSSDASTVLYSRTDSKMKTTLLSYVSYIKNADFYKCIDGKNNAKYMRELVLATADIESDMIFVSVVGDSDDMVEKLSEAIKLEVEKRTPEIQKANGDFNINLISESYYTSTDSLSSSVNSSSAFAITFSSGEFINVATAKKSHDDMMTSYKNTLTADNNALNTLQDPNIDTEKVKSIDAAKSTVKAVVEGLLLGFILAFLILMVIYCHRKEKEECS